jgi:hypothetical protein
MEPQKRLFSESLRKQKYPKRSHAKIEQFVAALLVKKILEMFVNSSAPRFLINFKRKREFEVLAWCYRVSLQKYNLEPVRSR